MLGLLAGLRRRSYSDLTVSAAIPFGLFPAGADDCLSESEQKGGNTPYLSAGALALTTLPNG
jgi:hypothetical protein